MSNLKKQDLKNRWKKLDKAIRQDIDDSIQEAKEKEQIKAQKIVGPTTTDYQGNIMPMKKIPGKVLERKLPFDGGCLSYSFEV